MKKKQVKILKEGYLSFPKVINIELTDKCPLNCPYCYKQLELTHHLDFEFLQNILVEFSEKGGQYVLLSGGEPLMYPHLLDTLKVCKKTGLKTALSTSGYGLSKNLLDELFQNGLTFLYISLNSHIPEINSLSRDGYEYAICAMGLCQKFHYPYKINTVIRHDNICTLDALICFAKRYGALGIEILSNKPDRNGEIISPLTPIDMKKLVECLENNEGYLSYQTCFTSINAYFNKKKNYKNLNNILKGCSAGRYSMAIFSDGSYTPCPHSYAKEKFDSLEEYWKNGKFRLECSIQRKIKECEKCLYNKYCSPCLISKQTPGCWVNYNVEAGKEDENI